jgi:hypothetical protein
LKTSSGKPVVRKGRWPVVPTGIVMVQILAPQTSATRRVISSMTLDSSLPVMIVVWMEESVSNSCSRRLLRALTSSRCRSVSSSCSRWCWMLAHWLRLTAQKR